MLDIDALMKNDFFTDKERLEVLNNEFTFCENVLKLLSLTKEDRERVYKQCDLIVEKKKQIVEKLLNNNYLFE